MGCQRGPGREGRPPMAREQILRVLLNHEGGIRQKQLTEALRVNPSTISEFVNKLEDSGYIERSTDPDDKRATRITLTEKGRARAMELQDERDEQFGVLFRNLTEEEKQELIRLLDKILPAAGPEEEKKRVKGPRSRTCPGGKSVPAMLC